MTTTANHAEIASFETGQTYSVASNGDHEIVYSWTVIARTAKFITVTEGDSTKPKKVSVKIDQAGEWALPDGVYSMAPVIRATNPNTKAAR